MASVKTLTYHLLILSLKVAAAAAPRACTMWKLLKYVLSRIGSFWIEVLKCGPMPHHVAFIMDGNRRYVKRQKIDLKEGYKKGENKLNEIEQFCARIGIREVTVYAFSIENFRRTSEEVELLMRVAEEYFSKFIENPEETKKRGVRVTIIGNLELIPPRVRKAISKAVLVTRDNRKCTLNFAFAYTSRDEITMAIRAVTDGVRAGALEVDDIDEGLLTNCMYTNHSSNPDILIRTSGDNRFSDFLLWQTATTFIHFTDVSWPEMSIWHLFILLIRYQRYCIYERDTSMLKASDKKPHPRVSKFLDDLDASRWALYEKYAGEETQQTLPHG